ncbi:MAG: cytochrome b N-terminal domain-containing protein [Thermaerobacter sp.]|nr:cytochrome b N-terminal domain-containing protein [Thermaerobacter sp.]
MGSRQTGPTNWTAAVRGRLEDITWDSLLPTEQPVYVRSVVYSFGALTLGSLVIVIASGILLAANGPFWWQTPGAGVFVRGLHFWGVQTFFFFMILHLTAQFFMGSWRLGRGGTWILGVLSFATSVITAFTGYLSRGDFFSQWNQVQSKDAFNGAGIGAWFNVLNNGQIYGLHIAVLPAILVALVSLHLLLVRRLGVVPPYPADNQLEEKEAER